MKGIPPADPALKKRRRNGSTIPVRFRLASNLALPVIVIAVLALGTLLLCEVPETAGDSASAWPSWIARALAVKVRMTDVSDLRWYAVAGGLAVVLAGMALGVIRRRPTDVPAARATSAPSRFGCLWLEWMAAFVVLWAAVSARINGTWELSRGWIFFLAVFAGWAVALSRLAGVCDARRIMTGASIVALAAAGMSLYHREALGERFFQLPVGPVTITAALGALWAGVAMSWMLGRGSVARSARPYGTPAVVWAMAVLVLALWLLAAAGRRAAVMAMSAATAMTLAVILWQRRPTRRVRGAIVIGAVALVASARCSSASRASAPSEPRASRCASATPIGPKCSRKSASRRSSDSARTSSSRK